MGWNARLFQCSASELKIQKSVLLLLKNKKVFQHAALSIQCYFKTNLLNSKLDLRSKVISSGVFQATKWNMEAGNEEIPLGRPTPRCCLRCIGQGQYRNLAGAEILKHHFFCLSFIYSYLSNPLSECLCPTFTLTSLPSLCNTSLPTARNFHF